MDNIGSCASHLLCWMNATCFVFAFIQHFIPFPTGSYSLASLFSDEIQVKSGLLCCLKIICMCDCRPQIGAFTELSF